jgi:hypothetical protein
MNAAGTLSFAADIRPLFTAMDIDHMIRASHIDLGDYETVKTHADKIYETVSSGTMPPPSSGEARWSAAMCKTFYDWRTQGCAP